jgi:hypothetical protein
MTKTLDEKIKERKQQAEDREIYSKAELVANERGTVSYPSAPRDHELSVHTFKDEANDLVITDSYEVWPNDTYDGETPETYSDSKLSISYKGKEVFAASGMFEFEVEAYSPGEWEQKLDALHAKVQQKIDNQEAAAAKKAAAEQQAAQQAEDKVKRSKWGIEDDTAPAQDFKKATSRQTSLAELNQGELKKIARPSKLKPAAA